jgi:hypothetical protein
VDPAECEGVARVGDERRARWCKDAIAQIEDATPAEIEESA